jgi:UV DNA damage repair endonuclease
MNYDEKYVKRIKESLPKRKRKIIKQVDILKNRIPQLGYAATISRLSNLTERTVTYHRGKKFVYHKRLTNVRVLLPLIRDIMPRVIARDILGVPYNG